MKPVVRYLFSFAVVVNLHAFIFFAALCANFLEASSVATVFVSLSACLFPSKMITCIHPSVGAGIPFLAAILITHMLWAAVLAAAWHHLKQRTSQNKFLDPIAEPARDARVSSEGSE